MLNRINFNQREKTRQKPPKTLIHYSSFFSLEFQSNFNFKKMNGKTKLQLEVYWIKLQKFKRITVFPLKMWVRESVNKINPKSKLQPIDCMSHSLLKIVIMFQWIQSIGKGCVFFVKTSLTLWLGGKKGICLLNE